VYILIFVEIFPKLEEYLKKQKMNETSLDVEAMQRLLYDNRYVFNSFNLLIFEWNKWIRNQDFNIQNDNSP